jgi:hypothetical protein
VNRDELNRPHFNPARMSGHHESFYQRANHPTRPVAFWIRYTVFSPAGRPGDAIGELWAVLFDGGTRQHAVAKQEYPIGLCEFRRYEFSVRVGDNELGPGRLFGACSGSSLGSTDALSWDLRYNGDSPPLFLLPQRLYRGGFPKAKSVVPCPSAIYRGEFVANGRTMDVTGWAGSQNHNWGSRHTDRYAFGQVTGFDDAPDSFLEVATARAKIGPVRTPVPDLSGATARRRTLAGVASAGVPGHRELPVLHLDVRLGERRRAYPGHDHRHARVVRGSELPQPTRRYEVLPEHEDRILPGDDHRQGQRIAG